jgi:cell wall-associated NlpC family hydrolase
VQEYRQWKNSRVLNGESIARTSKTFLGVPYLWGGTSSKGVDCSGFTKTVYRLNGVELNRDASQQARNGEDVVLDSSFSTSRKGDLLFFGQKATSERSERITHVGIYLENKKFIHSSGRVRFGSFDPSSPMYEGALLRRLVRSRRIITDPTVPEVRK